MGDKKIKKTQPEKKPETDKVLKKLEKVIRGTSLAIITY